jgi:hypothetical protein
MSLTTLIQKGIDAAFDSPLIEILADKIGAAQAVPILKEHFTFTATLAKATPSPSATKITAPSKAKKSSSPMSTTKLSLKTSKDYLLVAPTMVKLSAISTKAITKNLPSMVVAPSPTPPPSKKVPVEKPVTTKLP